MTARPPLYRALPRPALLSIDSGDDGSSAKAVRISTEEPEQHILEPNTPEPRTAQGYEQQEPGTAPGTLNPQSPGPGSPQASPPCPDDFPTPASPHLGVESPVLAPLSKGASSRTTNFTPEELSVAERRYTKIKQYVQRLINEGKVVAELHARDQRVVPKERQVNLDMYEVAQLKQREMIRYSPKFDRIADRCWSLLPKDENGQIDRDIYFSISKAMMRHMGINSQLSLNRRPKEIIQADWTFDSKGTGKMNKELFCDALFDLVDTWEETTNEDEYLKTCVAFYWKVFRRLFRTPWREYAATSARSEKSAAAPTSETEVTTPTTDNRLPITTSGEESVGTQSDAEKEEDFSFPESLSKSSFAETKSRLITSLRSSPLSLRDSVRRQWGLAELGTVLKAKDKFKQSVSQEEMGTIESSDGTVLRVPKEMEYQVKRQKEKERLKAILTFARRERARKARERALQREIERTAARSGGSGSEENKVRKRKPFRSNESVKGKSKRSNSKSKNPENAKKSLQPSLFFKPSTGSSIAELVSKIMANNLHKKTGDNDNASTRKSSGLHLGGLGTDWSSLNITMLPPKVPTESSSSGSGSEPASGESDTSRGEVGAVLTSSSAVGITDDTPTAQPQDNDKTRKTKKHASGVIASVPTKGTVTATTANCIELTDPTDVNALKAIHMRDVVTRMQQLIQAQRRSGKSKQTGTAIQQLEEIIKRKVAQREFSSTSSGSEKHLGTKQQDSPKGVLMEKKQPTRPTTHRVPTSTQQRTDIAHKTHHLTLPSQGISKKAPKEDTQKNEGGVKTVKKFSSTQSKLVTRIKQGSSQPATLTLQELDTLQELFSDTTASTDENDYYRPANFQGRPRKKRQKQVAHRIRVPAQAEAKYSDQEDETEDEDTHSISLPKREGMQRQVKFPTVSDRVSPRLTHALFVATQVMADIDKIVATAQVPVRTNKMQTRWTQTIPQPVERISNNNNPTARAPAQTTIPDLLRSAPQFINQFHKFATQTLDGNISVAGYVSDSKLTQATIPSSTKSSTKQENSTEAVPYYIQSSYNEEELTEHANVGVQVNTSCTQGTQCDVFAIEELEMGNQTEQLKRHKGSEYSSLSNTSTKDRLLAQVEPTEENKEWSQQDPNESPQGHSSENPEAGGLTDEFSGRDDESHKKTIVDSKIKRYTKVKGSPSLGRIRIPNVDPEPEGSTSVTTNQSPRMPPFRATKHSRGDRRKSAPTQRSTDEAEISQLQTANTFDNLRQVMKNEKDKQPTSQKEETTKTGTAPLASQTGSSTAPSSGFVLRGKARQGGFFSSKASHELTESEEKKKKARDTLLSDSSVMDMPLMHTLTPEKMSLLYPPVRRPSSQTLLSSDVGSMGSFTTLSSTQHPPPTSTPNPADMFNDIHFIKPPNYNDDVGSASSSGSSSGVEGVDIHYTMHQLQREAGGHADKFALSHLTPPRRSRRSKKTSTSTNTDPTVSGKTFATTTESATAETHFPASTTSGGITSTVTDNTLRRHHGESETDSLLKREKDAESQHQQRLLKATIRHSLPNTGPSATVLGSGEVTTAAQSLPSIDNDEVTLDCLHNFKLSQSQYLMKYNHVMMGELAKVDITNALEGHTMGATTATAQPHQPIVDSNPFSVLSMEAFDRMMDSETQAQAQESEKGIQRASRSNTGTVTPTVVEETSPPAHTQKETTTISENGDSGEDLNSVMTPFMMQYFKEFKGHKTIRSTASPEKEVNPTSEQIFSKIVFKTRDGGCAIEDTDIYKWCKGEIWRWIAPKLESVDRALRTRGIHSKVKGLLQRMPMTQDARPRFGTEVSQRGRRFVARTSTPPIPISIDPVPLIEPPPTSSSPLKNSPLAAAWKAQSPKKPQYIDTRPPSGTDQSDVEIAPEEEARSSRRRAKGCFRLSKTKNLSSGWFHALAPTPVQLKFDTETVDSDTSSYVPHESDKSEPEHSKHTKNIVYKPLSFTTSPSSLRDAIDGVEKVLTGLTQPEGSVVEDSDLEESSTTSFRQNSGTGGLHSIHQHTISTTQCSSQPDMVDTPPPPTPASAAADTNTKSNLSTQGSQRQEEDSLSHNGNVNTTPPAALPQPDAASDAGGSNSTLQQKLIYSSSRIALQDKQAPKHTVPQQSVNHNNLTQLSKSKLTNKDAPSNTQMERKPGEIHKSMEHTTVPGVSTSSVGVDHNTKEETKGGSSTEEGKKDSLSFSILSQDKDEDENHSYHDDDTMSVVTSITNTTSVGQTRAERDPDNGTTKHVMPEEILTACRKRRLLHPKQQTHHPFAHRHVLKESLRQVEKGFSIHVDPLSAGEQGTPSRRKVRRLKKGTTATCVLSKVLNDNPPINKVSMIRHQRRKKEGGAALKITTKNGTVTPHQQAVPSFHQCGNQTKKGYYSSSSAVTNYNFLSQTQTKTTKPLRSSMVKNQARRTTTTKINDGGIHDNNKGPSGNSSSEEATVGHNETQTDPDNPSGVGDVKPTVKLNDEERAVTSSILKAVSHSSSFGNQIDHLQAEFTRILQECDAAQQCVAEADYTNNIVTVNSDDEQILSDMEQRKLMSQCKKRNHGAIISHVSRMHKGQGGNLVLFSGTKDRLKDKSMLVGLLEKKAKAHDLVTAVTEIIAKPK